MLEFLVKKYDITNLSTIEKGFNGSRNAKQIRERWVNHLDPSGNHQYIYILIYFSDGVR